MDSWASWLYNLVEPLVKRAAVALGFGYASFEGASAVMETAFSSVQSAFSGIISEVAQLLAIAGFFDAMAITSGGLFAGLAWMSLKRFVLPATGAASA